MLTFDKKLRKWQRSPSPDRYQLSESEMPVDGDLDLSGVDEAGVSAILDMKLFNVCFTLNSTARSIQSKCCGVLRNSVSDFLSFLLGFATAKVLVPQCLNMADVATIRHYMDAYW